MVQRDIQLPSLGIIPGAEIDVPVKLSTTLPTGTYKIRADLIVDGRPVRGIVDECNFVNPVYQGMARMGNAMRVLPGNIEFEMSPGRTDSQRITIHNFSDEDIVVKAIPLVPDALANKVALVRGDSLSCADWIEIRPDAVPIRAGGERNVNVIMRMPKENDLPMMETVDLTNYYADIKLYGFYRDKSSAGSTTAMVNVSKKGTDPIPMIKEDSMAINSLGGTKFLIIGEFFERWNDTR